MDKKYTAKGTPKKEQTVTELSDKVSRAKSMVFADFRRIKHKQLEELRKNVKNADGEFVVTKNRLLLRALGDKKGSVKEYLEDGTATLFSYGDEVGPLKEMLKFFKAVNFGKVKAGLLGAKALSDKDIAVLATLPNRDALLGNLAWQLLSPVQGLHYALSWNIMKLLYALDNIKDKKSNIKNSN
ncbi:50S ribosomal protein L10 [Candidatus Gottesmanbacteria bacterium]|nr:50S ribosomal protein L10 [Candidatus Gottesmanbacteria bacterium]